MQTLLKQDDYICVRATAPDDYDMYTQACMACLVDKVINPGIDDHGAQDKYKQAKNAGATFWNKHLDACDVTSLVVLKTSPQTSMAAFVGIADIVFPHSENNLQAPLMCNAHILSPYRRLGLSHFLIRACVDYIADTSPYRDIHVMAHKDNIASIRGLQKKGFFVLRRGDTYITFKGRVPLLQAEKRVAPATAIAMPQKHCRPKG